MKIEYIEDNGNGVKWYLVDGETVGFTEDGCLLDDQGCPFTNVDAESVAKRDEVINAINEFENK